MTEQAGQAGHRWRRVTLAVSGLLAVLAVVLIGIALHGQQRVAEPPASAARTAAEGNLPVAEPTTDPSATTPSSTSSSTRKTSPSVVGPVLRRSVPVALTLPSVQLSSARLVTYGEDSHGVISIPPAAAGTPAGWFDGSPTPGQLGPSVIIGHVDSARAGPSVFYRLGALRPGDSAQVTLSNGTVAVFRVDSVEKYSKAAFPTLRVYGNINHAGLRLITCGGAFNAAKGHYEDNIVVFAHLVGSHAA